MAMLGGVRKKVKNEGDSARRVYVGNLPRDVEKDEIESWLKSICGKVGGLDAVKVVKRNRPEHSQCKLHEGYGHMVFSSDQHADEAIRMLNELQWGGRQIRAQIAKDQHIERKESKSKTEARLKKREARQRQRNRNMEMQIEEVMELVSKMPNPGGPSANDNVGDLHESSNGQEIIDWIKIPPPCDPCKTLGSSDRGLRKRWQVESFYVLLKCLLNAKKQMRIVDFGCGTGNLVLPLAFLFPDHHFIGLDMKPESIRLLQSRTEEAGLANLQPKLCMVEEYADPFDVCLALHACGNATDYSMLLALKHRAPYIVSPCCIGKLKFSMSGGSSFNSSSHTWMPTKQGEVASINTVERTINPVIELVHPRSKWMSSNLPDAQKSFEKMAKIADFFHSNDAKHDESSPLFKAACLCKLHIEIDRNESAKEVGYDVRILKTINWSKMAKNDILIGVPQEVEMWGAWDQQLGPRITQQKKEPN